MATNNYFHSSLNSLTEQSLVKDLMTESIQIQGYDVYYMPRESVNFDYLFGEDAISNFKKTYKIEAYIKDYNSYGGQGHILSKLGLDVQDEMTLQISIDRFDEAVKQYEHHIIRPREGDLIYFGLDKGSIFEISFVDNKVPFFQLGSLYLYEIEMKRFVFGAQNIETGIDEIDEVNTLSSTTQLVLGTTDLPSIEYIKNELVYQLNPDNTTYRASAEVVSFENNILIVTDTFGEFISGINIIGEVSGASWTYPIKNDSTFDNISSNNISDNTNIKKELDNIKVEESNPFIDF